MSKSGYRGYGVYIKNEDIQKIPSEILEQLDCGDFIIKETGNQKHLYLVTYKEKHVGICLSYFNAGYSETVSYDFNGTTKKWEYNSTDVWQAE